MTRNIHKFLTAVLVGVALLSAGSCTNAELSTAVPDGLVEMTFRPSLDGGLESKSIGDAGNIDQLRVGVYQVTSKGLVFSEILVKPWADVQKEGVSLKLTSNRAHKFIFWAEDKDNTAYQITESGAINTDYSDYLNSGFARTEELDAFCATSDVIPGMTDNVQKVVLKRPFAQLSFADKLKPENGVHTAKVTFQAMPVSFSPFNGTVQYADQGDIVFSFNDFPSEPLYSDGREYHYVSCNYIFASSKGTTDISCVVEFMQQGQSVARHEFLGENAISLEQNRKVNMIDYMVPEPQKWSEWNGKFPTYCTLNQDPEDQDCYIVDDAEDIAWLTDADNAGSLGEGKTFRLMADIDMGHKPGQKSMKLADGCTFDGNNHTIKGLKVMMGLFGENSVDLTIKNLTIDDAVVSGTTNSHRGVVASALRGSSSLSNVTVANSSVSTMKGAAGGMVGYISRKDPSNRAETINVVFDDCHVINTSVDAEGYEGHFLGMFRGYDNRETLVFKDNCSVTDIPGGQSLESYIVEGNEAVWINGNNFTKYNAWLGCEECYRGMVYLGSTRFIPKWDGKLQVTPLLADPVYDDSNEHKVIAGARRYMVYSPFDLAGARKASASPMALYFKESVDMNGQGKDGKYYVPKEFANRKCESDDDNWFKRFSYVRTLDGQNNTIYNLSLYSKAVNDSTYTSAFIHSVQGDSVTVHKNLNFRNCCSVAPVVQRTSEGMAGQDLSGGAIFIYNTGPDKTGSPTYTMDNIHIYDSQVFAVQHSGILAGLVSRGNVYNCSVNNCYIENYRCQETAEPFVKKVTIAGSEIEISAYFYSYGEIGALCGNVRRQSTISNCHVRNSIVHAYGEPDKEADMSSDGLIGKAAIATAKGLGYYLVPGRHVSTMIGDIRTVNGETITITGCTVDSATKCTAEHYKHNSSFPYIGQAYYIQFADEEGTVNVNGTKLKLANGNKNTNR